MSTLFAQKNSPPESPPTAKIIILTSYSFCSTIVLTFSSRPSRLMK